MAAAPIVPMTLGSRDEHRRLIATLVRECVDLLNSLLVEYNDDRIGLASIALVHGLLVESNDLFTEIEHQPAGQKMIHARVRGLTTKLQVTELLLNQVRNRLASNSPESARKGELLKVLTQKLGRLKLLNTELRRAANSTKGEN